MAPFSAPRSRALLALALVVVGIAACGPKAPAVVAPSTMTSCPPMPRGVAPARGSALPRQVLQGGDGGYVQAFKISPNGRYIVTTLDSAGFALWDVASHALLKRFRRGNPAEERTPTLRWQDDAHVIVESTRMTYVSDLGEDVPQAKHPQTSLARVLGTGPYPFFGCVGTGCELRQADGRAIGGLPQFAAGIDSIWDLTVSADGATVAHKNDGKVRLWHREGDRLVPAPELHVGSDVANLALAPRGGAILVSTKVNGAATLLLIAPGQKPRALPIPLDTENGSVYGLSFSPDGSRAIGIVSANPSLGIVHGGVVTWDLDTQRVAWTLKGVTAQPPAFVEGGRRVVLKPDAGGMMTVDAASGRIHGVFGGTSRVRAITNVLPIDADRVVAYGRDVVTVWSLAQARRVASYPVHDLRKLEVSPQGDLMLWSNGHLDACQTQESTHSPGSRLEVWHGLQPPLEATPLAVSPKPNQVVRAPGRWPKAPPFAMEFCEGDRMTHDVSLSQGLVIREAGADTHGVLDLTTGNVTPLADSPWVRGPHGSERGAISFAGDGKWVTAARIGRPEGGELGILVGRWDARTGKRDGFVMDRRPASDFNPIRSDDRAKVPVWLAMAPDASAAIVSDDTFFGLYDLATGQKTYPMPGQHEKYLATFGNDASTQMVARGDASFTILGKDGSRRGTSDFGAMKSARMSPDGSYVAASNANGALLIWDAKTAALRAVLADFEDEEWVISTPGGAYTGTVEVADRVGWVFEEPREHFGFEQFASFRDPEIVRRRLNGEDVDAPARVTRPPRVSLVGAKDGTVAATTLHVKAHASAVGRVDVVRVFVEGRPVGEKALCQREGDVELDVPLVSGMNRVNVVAFDHLGFASNAAVLDVANTDAKAARPNAFVVAVGVNKYTNLPRQMWLGAASNDATALAAAFKKMEGRTYGQVTTDVLTDADATPASIRAALAKLSQMKPDDVGVVFLAGHGIKPSATEDMVFVTGGVRLRADGKGIARESLVSDGVGWRDIAAAIAGARGRMLVLLDACHSGHVSQELVVPNEALANTLVREKRAGAVVFAAAKGRQLSLEPGNERALVLEASAKQRHAPTIESGHGYFTGALLASLAAADTDRNGDGVLQLSELIDETTRRVRDLSQGEQTPWVARRDLFGDFTVAGAAVRGK